MFFFPINPHLSLCEDTTQCEDHWLQLELEYGPLDSNVADVVIRHREPITAWKSNDYELIRLDKESTKRLIDALIVLYGRMP